MSGLIIQWCEVSGEATVTDPDVSLTRDDDAKLIQQLRDINGEIAEDGEYNWRVVGISRTPKTTTIEWSSERGVQAVTVVVW
jgi:hypothetical protein